MFRAWVANAGWLHHPAHTLTHHENNFLSHEVRLNSCFFHVNGKKRNLVIFFSRNALKTKAALLSPQANGSNSLFFFQSIMSSFIECSGFFPAVPLHNRTMRVNNMAVMPHPQLTFFQCLADSR